MSTIYLKYIYSLSPSFPSFVLLFLSESEGARGEWRSHLNVTGYSGD